jgi:hypothetical protein
MISIMYLFIVSTNDKHHILKIIMCLHETTYSSLYIYINDVPIEPWPLGMSFRYPQAQHRGHRAERLKTLFKA